MSSNSSSLGAALQRIATKLGLQPDSIEDVYPCTALQAALLVASLHGAGSYVSTFVFKLSKTLPSPRNVKAACEVVYTNTPILRTRFLQSKGTFLQVVIDTPLQWVEHDNLEVYLNQIQSEDNEQHGQEDARFAWINDVAGDTYLVWTLHHALYDEWSITLLFDDLSTLASFPSRAITRRPRFSKFVKALGQIDQHASRLFWDQNLEHLAQCTAIPSSEAIDLKTSQHVELCEPVSVALDGYHFSTLMIAAWSICISKLSESDTVAFGNVVNGRTLPVPGIIDICGPTMTTVPYVVGLPWKDTVGAFIDKLEQMRNDMIPYEQTGFDEYKRRSGSGRYETILSIRSSQTGESDADRGQQLRPSDSHGRQVRHPCLIYLDVEYDTSQCAFKASYDERYLDSKQMSNILSQFSTCVESLSKKLDFNLREFWETIKLSGLSWPGSDNKIRRRTNGPVSSVDQKALKYVQEAVRAIGVVRDGGSVTPDMTLRELGLDSLSSVAFARKLSETIAVPVPVKEVIGLRRTVAEVAKITQNLLRGTYEEQKNGLNLMSEAERYAKDFLRGEITSESEPTSGTDANDGTVLLTGASGYVGIAILQQLLASTSFQILLLVRCKSPEHGLERIRRVAEIAQWDRDELSLLEYRVQVLPSDLAAADLGLRSQQWTCLQNTRVIIHNGARVDFALDYRDLEATNVAATASLLSHCLRSPRTSRFVYVTGGRGSPLQQEKHSLETTGSALIARGNGYAQTKFTSEVLVQRAAELCPNDDHATSMKIVHPGIIIGNERTGVANTDDFIWRYVAASVQMGAYVPAVPTKREWVNLMTTESVASEIMSAAIDANDHGTGDNKFERRSMRAGLPVARFWEVCIETLDPDRVLLEPVSEWEWSQRLQDELSERSTQHPLFALSPLLQQGLLKGIGGPGPRVDDRSSRQEMLALERAVAANVRYLDDRGYFANKGVADEGGRDTTTEVFKRSRH